MASSSDVMEVDVPPPENDSAATSDAGGGAGIRCWAEEVEGMRSTLDREEILRSMCHSYGIREKDYTPFCAKDGWGPCKTPPEGSNALCVFEGMLQAGVRFPLHDFYAKVLKHFNLAPSQLTPNAWRYLAGFVLLCDGNGVRPMVSVFRHYFKLHGGKLLGWYYFEPHTQSSRRLFKSDGRLPFNEGWKKRFFFLESRSADTPWRCPQKWGKPSTGAYGDPVLKEAASTAISKLEAEKEKRSISLMEVIDKSQYQDSFPVRPPLQEPVKEEASDGAAASTPPPKRKYRALSAITAPQQLADDVAMTPSPPGFAPMGPSDAGGSELSRTLMVYQLMQSTETELSQVKEELLVEKAQRADEVAELKIELAAVRANVAQLTEKLEVEKYKHMAKTRRFTEDLQAAQTELKLLRAVHAQQTTRVRQLTDDLQAAKAEHAIKVHKLSEEREAAEAEHESKVRQLTEQLQAAIAKHMAKVHQFTEDLHATEAEHAAKVLQLTKELQAEKTERQLKVIDAEHTSGAMIGAMLSKRYATGLRDMRDLVVPSVPPGFPPRQAPAHP